MEFGRKGIDLLKEIVNHDQDSLSAYNVRARPTLLRAHPRHAPTPTTPLFLHPALQEDLVRTIVGEVHEHDTLALRITQ